MRVIVTLTRTEPVSRGAPATCWPPATRACTARTRKTRSGLPLRHYFAVAGRLPAGSGQKANRRRSDRNPGSPPAVTSARFRAAGRVPGLADFPECRQARHRPRYSRSAGRTYPARADARRAGPVCRWLRRPKRPGLHPPTESGRPGRDRLGEQLGIVGCQGRPHILGGPVVLEIGVDRPSQLGGGIRAGLVRSGGWHRQPRALAQSRPYQQAKQRPSGSGPASGSNIATPFGPRAAFRIRPICRFAVFSGRRDEPTAFQKRPIQASVVCDHGPTVPPDSDFDRRGDSSRIVTRSPRATSKFSPTMPDEAANYSELAIRCAGRARVIGLLPTQGRVWWAELFALVCKPGLKSTRGSFPARASGGRVFPSASHQLRPFAMSTTAEVLPAESIAAV